MVSGRVSHHEHSIEKVHSTGVFTALAFKLGVREQGCLVGKEKEIVKVRVGKNCWQLIPTLSEVFSIRTPLAPMLIPSCPNAFEIDPQPHTNTFFLAAFLTCRRFICSR